jgi:hypothetical protein
MTDLSTNVGWTAQHPFAFIHDEGAPGQTFSEDQLPHPEVQRASGINPELYRSAHGLTVTPAETSVPAFVGTETGVAPEAALLLNGNVESFASRPVEPLAPPVALSTTITERPVEDEELVK